MPSISRTPSIYQIRHTASGKVYVGSAIDPRKRWTEHRRTLRIGKHHSRYLQRAWDKYGKDSFVFEIIEPVLFVEDLLVREQYWIDTLRSNDPFRGYNIASIAGSMLGTKRTNEERAKISERSKAQFADPVQRLLMSERAKAQFADPGVRAKIAERTKAQFADPISRKKHADAQRARCADPVEREKRSARGKALAADPAYRAKMSASAKTWMSAPAAIARRADPADRAKRSEAMKARWADPAYRAKLDDSKFGERQSAKMKAVWAERKKVR